MEWLARTADDPALVSCPGYRGQLLFLATMLATGFGDPRNVEWQVRSAGFLRQAGDAPGVGNETMMNLATALGELLGLIRDDPPGLATRLRALADRRDVADQQRGHLVVLTMLAMVQVFAVGGYEQGLRSAGVAIALQRELMDTQVSSRERGQLRRALANLVATGLHAAKTMRDREAIAGLIEVARAQGIPLACSRLGVADLPRGVFRV